MENKRDWTLEDSPFEAEFFGGPVLRLEFAQKNGEDINIREDSANLITKEGKDRRAGLIFCRISVKNKPLIRVLINAGFREVERQVTFERRIEPTPDADPRIRSATTDDIDACVAIAGKSFMYDRFHADPLIPKHVADAIKKAWVRNGLKGRAGAAFVALEADKIVGFNLCMLRDGIATIDLIAVSKEVQGRGFGSGLVKNALVHYAKKADTMRVSTQASNRSSMRLYTSQGFKQIEEAITLHWVLQDYENNIASRPIQK